MEYVSKTVNDWDENKSFFSLIDSIIKIDMMKDQQVSFNHYLEASNDRLLIQYSDDNARTLNIKALVNHYEFGFTKLTDDTFMLIGNFYTENNRKILYDRIESISKDKTENSGLIWLTNSESKNMGKNH